MQAFKAYGEKTGILLSILVSSFSSAAKFYLQAIGNEHVDLKLKEHEFIAINNPWLKEVP